MASAVGCSCPLIVINKLTPDPRRVIERAFESMCGRCRLVVDSEKEERLEFLQTFKVTHSSFTNWNYVWDTKRKSIGGLTVFQFNWINKDKIQNGIISCDLLLSRHCHKQFDTGPAEFHRQCLPIKMQPVQSYDWVTKRRETGVHPTFEANVFQCKSFRLRFDSELDLCLGHQRTPSGRARPSNIRSAAVI